LHVFAYIGVGEGERAGGNRTPPLGSYPDKSGTHPGKFKYIRANLKIKTFFKRSKL